MAQQSNHGPPNLVSGGTSVPANPLTKAVRTRPKKGRNKITKPQSNNQAPNLRQPLTSKQSQPPPVLPPPNANRRFPALNQSLPSLIVQPIIGNPRITLSSVYRVPSFYPVYFPYAVQHALLNQVQNILEQSLFEWAKRWIPQLLTRVGWNTAEAGELSRWAIELALYPAPVGSLQTLRTMAPMNPLIERVNAVRQLRNTAVHRLPTPANYVFDMMTASLKLVEMLQDDLRTGQMQQIVYDVSISIREVEIGKDTLEDTLVRTLQTFQDEKDHLEQRIIELDKLAIRESRIIQGNDKALSDHVCKELEASLIRLKYPNLCGRGNERMIEPCMFLNLDAQRLQIPDMSEAQATKLMQGSKEAQSSPAVSSGTSANPPQQISVNIEQLVSEHQATAKLQRSAVNNESINGDKDAAQEVSKANHRTETVATENPHHSPQIATSIAKANSSLIKVPSPFIFGSKPETPAQAAFSPVLPAGFQGPAHEQDPAVDLSDISERVGQAVLPGTRKLVLASVQSLATPKVVKSPPSSSATPPTVAASKESVPAELNLPKMAAIRQPLAPVFGTPNQLGRSMPWTMEARCMSADGKRVLTPGREGLEVIDLTLDEAENIYREPYTLLRKRNLSGGVEPTAKRIKLDAPTRWV